MQFKGADIDIVTGRAVELKRQVDADTMNDVTREMTNAPLPENVKIFILDPERIVRIQVNK